MQAQADLNSPDSLHMWAQVWRGIGIGLSFSPLSSVCMRGMPPSMISQATGIFNLTRQLAGSIGIAALNTVLISRTVFHSAIMGQQMAMVGGNTQHFLAGARGMLVAHGLAPRVADQTAMAMLAQAVRQQVQVISYADLFYLLLAIVVLGFLPIPFMGTRRA
jgi:DHA2 family multidrug resistance protein